jgi:hypothetical protein
MIDAFIDVFSLVVFLDYIFGDSWLWCSDLFCRGVVLSQTKQIPITVFDDIREYFPVNFMLSRLLCRVPTVLLFLP